MRFEGLSCFCYFFSRKLFVQCKRNLYRIKLHATIYIRDFLLFLYVLWFAKRKWICCPCSKSDIFLSVIFFYNISFNIFAIKISFYVPSFINSNVHSEFFRMKMKKDLKFESIEKIRSCSTYNICSDVLSKALVFAITKRRYIWCPCSKFSFSFIHFLVLQYFCYPKISFHVNPSLIKIRAFWIFPYENEKKLKF